MAVETILLPNVRPTAIRMPMIDPISKLAAVRIKVFSNPFNNCGSELIRTSNSK